MINPQFPEEAPSRVPERTLRQFAGLCLALFGGAFAASWYRHHGTPSASGWAAGALAVLVGALGLIRPGAIRAVYLGATALTRPIGHVVGLVLLAAVYYAVLTPMALAFRLAGRDALGRRLRPGAGSYWVDHATTADVRLYLRQYQRQGAGEPAPAPSTPVRAAAPAIVNELSNHQSPAMQGAHHGPV